MFDSIKLRLDLRTTGATCIFIAVLLAYTVQTELAQFVTGTYSKPYFLFYLTHSGYSLLLPLHLLVLRLLGISISESFRTVRALLRLQFATPIEPAVGGGHSRAMSRPGFGRSLSRASLPDSGDRPRQPRRTSMRRLLGKEERKRVRRLWKWRFGTTVLKLTFLIALPALSWYVAVPLTTMTNLTSLYNTFAFWAYLLATRMLGEPATKWKLGSVLLAVGGVFVISYGDSIKKEDPTDDSGSTNKHVLVGNALGLFASIAYAFYEVWYKINVSLPDPEEDQGDEAADDEADALLAADDAESSESPSSSSATVTPNNIRTYPPSELSVSVASASVDVTNPSSATFLLYTNLITALIGVCTFIVLWIPIPVLHFFGWEKFELPPADSLLPIGGIVLSGILFNAGFMLLLSLWGPVIASVGNLCTLVLVAIADNVIMGTSLTAWSASGSFMVILAFSMLVFGPRDAFPQEDEDKDADLDIL